MKFVSLLMITYVAVLLPCTVFSQPLPFLTDDEIRMLQNELSGDRAFEHIRVLSQ